MKLKDRVAMVTGAAQGIGAAIVREFVREGAMVNAIDIKPEVRDVCAGIGARPFCFDVTDFSAYEDCVSEIVRNNQRIDVLVNNAAIVDYDDILHDSLEALAPSAESEPGISVRGMQAGGAAHGRGTAGDGSSASLPRKPTRPKRAWVPTWRPKVRL